MSRIGKKPIIVPENVEITITGNHVTVKGPKGELTWDFPSEITVIQSDKELTVTRKDDEPESRSLHGLTRALLNNMVVGVSEGFEKRLEITGVGYRAQVSGKKLTLSLGFSHPIDMEAPEGITIEIDKEQKNVIIISGIDKQLVGEVAANIRKHRPPEPYKGKGIRYAGEYVHRKTGKTAVAKEI